MSCRKKIISLVFFGIVMLTLVACKANQTQHTPGSVVGLPDPSLTHCKELGYTYEFRTLREPVETEQPESSKDQIDDQVAPPVPVEIDGGISFSVCIFPDGTECDTWSFFRGECSPGQFEHAEDGLPLVNVVQEAGLYQTVALEILELNKKQPTRSYSHLITIKDKHTLDQIATALDAIIWASGQEDCIPSYKLLFHLADSNVQEFNYHLRWDRMTSFDYGNVCHPNQDSSLRWEQEFLDGDGGNPPGVFDVLIKAQITSTLANSINVSERLGLNSIAEIEILETVLVESLDDQGRTILDMETISRFSTGDHQMIEGVVSALDKEFEFVSRVGFHPQFELRFTLEDGTVRILGYGSEAGKPTVLRGNPTIWQGRDILPDSEFDALFEELLASIPYE